MAEFQKLREGGYGTTFSNNYLEQGRYAEAVASTGAEADLVDRATPAVRVRGRATTLHVRRRPAAQPRSGVRAGARRPGGGVTLVDLDARRRSRSRRCQRRPRAAVHERQGHLLGCDDEAWPGDARSKGLPVAASPATTTTTRASICSCSALGAHPLLRQRDGGTFRGRHRQPRRSRPTPGVHRSAAFVGRRSRRRPRPVPRRRPGLPRPTGCCGTTAIRRSPTSAPSRGSKDRLLRRALRSCRPTTTTGATSICWSPAPAPGRRAAAAQEHAGRHVSRHRRRGRAAGAGAYRSVAAGDVNKDGFTDFYFGRDGDRGALTLSDGRGRFREAASAPGRRSAFAAQFIDYDNDGLLDLLAMGSHGSPEPVAQPRQRLGGRHRDGPRRPAADCRPPTAWQPRRGRHRWRWRHRSRGARSARRARVLRNEAATVTARWPCALAGRVSNRSGVGSKIELRAGSLRQKLETASAWPAAAPADILFGLGSRPAADVVRVLWPAGILQAEIPESDRPAPPVSRAPPGASRRVAESPSRPDPDRARSQALVVSLSLHLEWHALRVRHRLHGRRRDRLRARTRPLERPRPGRVHARARRRPLQPRDGRLDLRVTNELEEALFVDRLGLVAVDHPADVEIHPREGLVSPPFPAFELYAADAARPVLAATDDRGRDVTEQVRDLDRRFVDDLPIEPIRGYAQTHTLTLDLGARLPHTLLLLTGWTDYAFSSDNIAAGQAGLTLAPPSLQVRRPGGDWVTLIEEIGIPVGRPQTIVVDLGGTLPDDAREVRIVTSMRIYWDQVRVATRGTRSPRAHTPRTGQCRPALAGLLGGGEPGRTRSPSATTTAACRRNPRGKCSPAATRERATCERCSRPPTISSSSRVPATRWRSPSRRARCRRSAQAGRGPTSCTASATARRWTSNSATPDQTAPLPFRAMTRYPYAAPEQYPETPEHRAYQQHWNTRVVTRSVPPLELSTP